MAMSVNVGLVVYRLVQGEAGRYDFEMEQREKGFG